APRRGHGRRRLQGATVEGEAPGKCAQIAVAGDRQRALIDRPRRHRGRRALQGPGAGATLLEDAKIQVLRADLRDGETGVWGAAEPERVGGAERDDITGDRRPGLDLQEVRAARKGDGVGGAAVAAGDAAAVDDREAAADNAGAADMAV